MESLYIEIFVFFGFKTFLLVESFSWATIRFCIIVLRRYTQLFPVFINHIKSKGKHTLPAAWGEGGGREGEGGGDITSSGPNCRECLL